MGFQSTTSNRMANSVDPEEMFCYKLQPSHLDQHCLHRYLYQSTGLFVCAEVLRHSQTNGVMSSAVSLANHIFTGHA